MTSRRPASVLRKLFGSLKSRDSLKSAREGRLLRLEVLEERTLLTASAGVAATDAISYEGSKTCRYLLLKRINLVISALNYRTS